jgi:hypothetical protein
MGDLILLWKEREVRLFPEKLFKFLRLTCILVHVDTQASLKLFTYMGISMSSAKLRILCFYLLNITVNAISFDKLFSSK